MQHYIPFILGHPVSIVALCDEHGHIARFKNVLHAKKAESFARATCVVMGCSCALALCPLTTEEILSLCPLNTVSQAWYLGKLIYEARWQKKSPVDAMVASQMGEILMIGSITDVKRDINAGFTRGFFTVTGKIYK